MKEDVEDEKDTYENPGAGCGVCILLSSAAEDAPRLRKFAATNDGFEIARIDLETRGAGELAGIAQHGDAGLKAADLARDAELAMLARRDVLELAARGGLPLAETSERKK